MSTLVAPVTTAVTNAEAGTSKLTTELQTMKGETSLLAKHLYNNLMAIPNASAMFINTVTGDNVCCAVYENTCTITAVDDVTCTPANFAAVAANVDLFKGSNTVNLINDDWKVADLSGIPPCNVIVYHGSQEAGRIASALYRYEPILEKEFVLVANDWANLQTRSSVEGFIADMRMTVEYSVSLGPDTPEGVEIPRNYPNEWGTGVYVAAVKKTRIQY